MVLQYLASGIFKLIKMPLHIPDLISCPKNKAQHCKRIQNKYQQAEAEVVPSSSLVEVGVGVGVEVGV